jgi:hypothetical protein
MLSTIILVPDHPTVRAAHPEDLVCIVKAFARYGYSINEDTAEYAWDRYSASMAAGWMMLPDTQSDIVACALPYLRPMSGDL